ncbi:hypothetical protein N9W89_13805, partial [Hellea sp.]|nr:hypothetical protein [Hellea sp.]
QPLDGSKGTVHGYQVYDCGYVLHAAAESAALEKSGSTIIDIWKKTITDYKTKQASYSPSDFVQAAESLSGPEYREFSNPFLTGFEANRWDKFSNIAKNVGITLERSEDAHSENSQLLIGHWLMPLLAANCDGGHGFYNNAEAKRLHGNDCKPPIESGLDLVSVTGVSLITEPLKALETVRKICSDKGELILGLKDGTDLAPVSCELDIPPLPPAFKVVSFPDLPPLLTD